MFVNARNYWMGRSNPRRVRSVSVPQIPEMGRDEKGAWFEGLIGRLLNELEQRFPEYVSVRAQPLVAVRDQEVKRADFDLTIRIGPEEQLMLIECQCRQRFSPAILDKIDAMIAQSPRKTFHFVYAFETQLGDSQREAFGRRGVMCSSLSQFMKWIDGYYLHLKSAYGSIEAEPTWVYYSSESPRIGNKTRISQSKYRTRHSKSD